MNWFDQGFARVARNGRVGYIDKTGREIFLLPSRTASRVPLARARVFCFESGGELIFDEEGNRSTATDSRLRASGFGFGRTPTRLGRLVPRAVRAVRVVVVVPSVSAPASTGSSQSDPVPPGRVGDSPQPGYREPARLQVKLIEDPNSAYIKHNIQTQQNIINTCNEMIAIYQ